MTEKKTRQYKNHTTIDDNGVVIGLSAVIVAVRDFEPKVFIVRDAEHGLAGGSVNYTGHREKPRNEPVEEAVAETLIALERDALPFGPFDPAAHETLERGTRDWVREQTPLTPGYFEQLYTFGNRGRHAGPHPSSPRVISVGYLALTYEDKALSSDKAFFGDWYAYFPWEDARGGKPDILTRDIEPALKKWIASAPDAAARDNRELRARLCFGLDGVAWDDERVLERLELLYEARLLHESIRDKKIKVDHPLIPSRPMRYDHRRILATAISRLRGKLKYRPVVFELMPPEFTLLSLQKTVEAIVGHRLHKQNFRRLVEGSGMVEEVEGRKSVEAGGRPAALFRFRREVLLERAAVGMRMSAVQ